MNPKRGSCLCGALTYEFDGEPDGVWVCHCSNCRKASGGSGNTIIVVPKRDFRWLTGADHRVTYALRPTYSITRCRTCGTPLPAEEDETNVYLTAGTLDTPLNTGIRTHIFHASRPGWDHDTEDVRYFDERRRGRAARAVVLAGLASIRVPAPDGTLVTGGHDAKARRRAIPPGQSGHCVLARALPGGGSTARMQGEATAT